jgi:hypothetical protein
MPTSRLVRSFVATLALAAGGLVAAPGAQAAAGDPWVVSLGDSYISGEAGRWAGSSNRSSTPADVLGSGAYLDAGRSESIPGCHRASSAQIHLGAGYQSLNLACSGATTATRTGSTFKPGLDFYDDGAGKVGQAAALRREARGRDVRLVTVSIGGNDFGFADIVTSCVLDFLGSSSLLPNYCFDDRSVRASFTAENVAAVRARIATALQNVRTAMRDAGHADSSWTLLVQTYPSPIAEGANLRYRQSGYTRQSVGGCGFWDADADWANRTAMPTINGAVTGAVKDAGLTNAKVLDLSRAMNGRRLCEKGVGLYEEVGLTGWQAPTAVDRTEWINQIRTVSTIAGPYQVQESIHPNYWGQLAIRSCIRQAYEGGRGGSCERSGTGLSSRGEPRMTLR